MTKTCFHRFQTGKILKTLTTYIYFTNSIAASYVKVYSKAGSDCQAKVYGFFVGSTLRKA